MGYNIIFTFIKLYLPGRKKNKMNEDLLVIKKNEVPAIQFNKKELIECVDEILKQHKGILYTIEDIPKAKKVVADLRKQKKYLNSERISACKPYEAIVKQTKADMDDVLARYDTVIQEIDTQIKESENVWKKEAVEPFEFDFDPIPVPEPISRKVSSSSTPIQKNRKSSINNSSVQNYPYPLNREIHKPVMKTLNIKIRGEESVIRDIMKYIYDKKDIEILQ